MMMMMMMMKMMVSSDQLFLLGSQSHRLHQRGQLYWAQPCHRAFTDQQLMKMMMMEMISMGQPCHRAFTDQQLMKMMMISMGQPLPPGFHRPAADEDDDDLHGPALPPGFHRPAADEDDDGDDLHGPALPPGYTAEPSSSDEEEEEEDEEVIGPMPAQGAIQDSVALDIERRAQKMKDRLTGADDGPEEVVRETWMTELPPTLQHIGLGARTFKKRAGPESKDRSLWTDTPADRERKLRERLEGKKSEEIESVPQLSHKELQMAEKVSKYNETKRGESLISLHEKQLKKRKLDEGAKSVERRAFDRDQDLQVNKFDEAQKQRLLKKSQELNTRFGHSKEKMFL
ncbi:GPALPP motifs-containing protein 1-like [Coregonus clupeaformis]|uniref:GPALPP motifs-containing protein 1-like n=1 Tax=Coregonus clupeaformis TaxID=59861 RepID=UPI001E1C7947|nr:GPALPP motifs-containing protein 1-like [Coregonus clupeaformis]